jgi:hypothetical protein
MAILRLFSYSNETSVSIMVVVIVEPIFVASEAFHHQLDSTSSVGCKHDIEVFWVGIEQS